MIDQTSFDQIFVWDDCTTSCLLLYSYTKQQYKMIAIDLSKQKVLDAELKAIQQINFK